MVNKIVLSVAVATALTSTSLSAGALEDKIKNLEIMITDMKKANAAKIKVLEDTISSIKEAKIENEEVIEELDERVSDVEFRSYTDKIALGVGLRVENNNYSNEKADGSSFNSTINRVKTNINMKSQISDDMKFVGRLSMYKNWGDQTPRFKDNDYAQGRRPNGSELYVERAYVDWLTNRGSTVPFTLSLGRLSTTDGPSYNFKENTKRKGTFSALAYDWAMDGVVMTANLDKIISGTDIQLTYFTPSVEDEPNTISNIGYDGTEDTKVTGIIINKTFKELSFKNDFQIFHAPAADTTVRTDYGRENLGDMTISGVMAEATKINGNLDLFAHYARNKAEPNGKLVQVNAAGAMMGMTQTGTTSTETKTGNAIWIGARYHINKDWKIGAEYNKGSQNWFGYTVGSNDPTNKLAVRGDAVELYVTKSINKYANFRLGYVDINLDYTNSGMLIGTPWAIDSNQAKAMGAVKNSKNTYLTFNLLF